MSAVVKFALRGASLNAYLHSGSGKVPIVYLTGGGTAPVSAVDAGALGGHSINFDGGGAVKGLIFPAFNNVQKTGKMSGLHRINPTYSGSPVGNSSVLSVAGPRFLNGNSIMQFQLDHLTDGNLYVSVSDALGGGLVFTNIGAWSPVAGTRYDIVMSFTGLSSSNQLKVYIDSVLFAQTTVGRTWNATDTLQTEILVACGNNQSLQGFYKSEELVYWDDVIDPVALGLIGAARTQYVDLSSYVLDPTLSTDPGQANVLSGTAYEINGVPKTGSLVLVSNTYMQAALIGQGLPTNAATKLYLTQGDVPVLSFLAKLGPTLAAFDLTAATFSTQIRMTDSTYRTIPNSQHTIAPDQVTNRGAFTVALTALDTAALELGADHEVVTTITQGALVTIFHGAKLLTVLPNTPST